MSRIAVLCHKGKPLRLIGIQPSGGAKAQFLHIGYNQDEGRFVIIAGLDDQASGFLVSRAHFDEIADVGRSYFADIWPPTDIQDQRPREFAMCATDVMGGRRMRRPEPWISIAAPRVREAHPPYPGAYPAFFGREDDLGAHAGFPA